MGVISVLLHEIISKAQYSAARFKKFMPKNAIFYKQIEFWRLQNEKPKARHSTPKSYAQTRPY
jgi:hypothetical protein